MMADATDAFESGCFDDLTRGRDREHIDRTSLKGVAGFLPCLCAVRKNAVSTHLLKHEDMSLSLSTIHAGRRIGCRVLR